MFAPWYRKPIVGLTDRTVPLALELGSAPDELVSDVSAHTDPLTRAKALEARLLTALPALDPQAVLARDAVERVRAEPELQTVAALASAMALAPRALQRLFRDYIGVGPKWVVRRFRLQEAAELLETTNATVASVAAHLGYFDQAHFVRDFKAVVGATPSEYVRKARAKARA
jgi:transcriptional regulator GlxA family with amidase domain